MTAQQAIEAVEGAIVAALNVIDREVEYMDLAGIGYHAAGDYNPHNGAECAECDCAGANPYAQLLDVLDRARSAAETHRSHKHHWDEDQRCSVCGADGLA